MTALNGWRSDLCAILSGEIRFGAKEGYLTNIVLILPAYNRVTLSWSL